MYDDRDLNVRFKVYSSWVLGSTEMWSLRNRSRSGFAIKKPSQFGEAS